jgi:hypothetical protein
MPLRHSCTSSHLKPPQRRLTPPDIQLQPARLDSKTPDITSAPTQATLPKRMRELKILNEILPNPDKTTFCRVVTDYAKHA